MLIWFLVDCVALFNKTVMNQWIMGRSWEGYKYMLRYDLPSHHIYAIKPHPETNLKPDLEEQLKYIWKKEKLSVWLRAVLWAPMKLYFYFVACRYAT